MTATRTAYAQLRSCLLAHFEEQEAQALCRIVFEDGFGLDWCKVLSDTARALSDEETAHLQEIANRLLTDEPVQYILEKAWFHGHLLRVTPAVLIPRPETEFLVEHIVQQQALSPTPPPLRICDACTGSGCIAISLAKALKDSQVSAFDISTEALQVAEGNAQACEANVHFFQGDLLSPNTLPTATYDILVSNPPYVMQQEAAAMERKVLDHEPHLALFVPNRDALRFYKALAQWGTTCLSSEGIIYMEINALLSNETANLFRQKGYREVQILADCFDKPRFIKCKRPTK